MRQNGFSCELPKQNVPSRTAAWHSCVIHNGHAKKACQNARSIVGEPPIVSINSSMETAGWVYCHGRLTVGTAPESSPTWFCKFLKTSSKTFTAISNGKGKKLLTAHWFSLATNEVSILPVTARLLKLSTGRADTP